MLHAQQYSESKQSEIMEVSIRILTLPAALATVRRNVQKMKEECQGQGTPTRAGEGCPQAAAAMELPESHIGL